MDNSSEKNFVYEQMRLLIDERRKLTKQYYDLKERLLLLDRLSNYEDKRQNPIKNSRKKVEVISLKEESEYQRYILSKNNPKKKLPYKTIALKISSILKESGHPLSNKEIYTALTNIHWEDINFETGVLKIDKTLYYKNLSHYEFVEPKTKASTRFIVLDEDTLSLLKEWKEIQNSVVKT